MIIIMCVTDRRIYCFYNLGMLRVQLYYENIFINTATNILTGI
uniref:Uncharacterized protein n=1 Tax=Anguilla anguilla TaxID=7936 RepID=A0A0E9QIU1_ANGAN